MKEPVRQETNFSLSNVGALWPHKYSLKVAFYLERFRTWLERLLAPQVCQLLTI